MNENFDFQDTIPEISNEDTQSIENGEDGIVTPDNNDLLEEDVIRDAEAMFAQGSVSEKAAEPFVSVQYNHKNRDFTKDEAIKFIQKGMHTEALRTKLEYLANAQGTDVNSLVEKIVSAPENAYRKHLEAMYGKESPDVEIGMKIFREKQSEEYKKIMRESENSIEREKENKSVISRLADEYVYLKEEIPDAPEYSDLPDSVIIEAAEGKRDLYSAYLCYLHKEKMKINAAKKTEEAATTASSGSMGQTGAEDISSAERNFLLGLWGR